MVDKMILGMGSPSDLKAFDKRYTLLDDLTIQGYLEQQGIRQLDPPLLVSCHRTPKRVVSYALQSDNLLSRPKDRAVAVLYGGLAFALPGIFASETAAIPVIGVPAASSSIIGGEYDAALSVYNLPPGTVVGGMPPHGKVSTLEKAVFLAEDQLRLESPELVVIADPKEKAAASAMGILDSFGIKYTQKKTMGKTDGYDLCVHIASGPGKIVHAANTSHIALQHVTPGHDMREIFDEIGDLANSLYFGRPENAALFAVRAMAMSDPDLRAKLGKYRSDQMESVEKKYGAERNMTKELKRRKRR